MEELQSIRKDAEVLPFASPNVQRHILTSVLTRFRRADRHVVTAIDEKFRLLTDQHRRRQNNVKHLTTLPPITSSQSDSQATDRIDFALQRRILAELVAPKVQSTQKVQPAAAKKRPKFKHLYTHTQPLSSMQRFYNFADVELPTDYYSSSGIYQLVNIYKADNVDLSYLEEVQPKAVRNKLNNRNLENKLSNLNMLAKSSAFRQTIKLLGEENQEMFLTRVDKGRESVKVQTNPQAESQASPTDQPVPTQAEQQQDNIIVFEQLSYLTIHKLQLVEDKELEVFRLEHLPSWGRIVSLIQSIIRFLKKYCIKSATIKGNTLLLLDGANHRISEQSIMDCFVNRVTFEKLIKDHRKLQFRRDRNLAAKAIQQCWRGLAVTKRYQRAEINKRRAVSRLLCYWRHGKFRRQLEQSYQLKVQWCAAAQQRLENDWSSYEQAVEVHIPSFSLDQWSRLTTHHMASFEGQLSRLWRAQKRAVVLVIPAVSQTLLSEYFKLLPIRRPELHIVVPDTDRKLFPSCLSLVSLTYYSTSTLKKIKEAVAGRKAYIVPGKMSSGKEEMLLSYHLQLPLYCPDIKLIKDWSLTGMKQLLQQAMLPTLPWSHLPPGSSLEMLAAQLLVLAVRHPRISVWLLKIEEEFLGRGIAQVSVTDDKQLQRAIVEVSKLSSDAVGCEKVCEDLHGMFIKLLECRLRCCEQLYRRTQFITKMLQKGGIIEAQPLKMLNKLKTYEIAIEVTPSQVEFRGILRCIQMAPYCQQAYVKGNCCPVNIQSIVERLGTEVVGRGYRGFCSLTILVEDQNHKHQSNKAPSEHNQGDDDFSDEQPNHYIIDIKPYLTSAASSLFLMTSVSQKYLFVEHVSHANMQDSSPFELLASIRKSREKEQGCLLLTMRSSCSLLVSNRQLVDVRRTAVEVLRGIQYRGTSTLSGEKEFVRSDFYSLSDIATAIKTAL